MVTDSVDTRLIHKNHPRNARAFCVERWVAFWRTFLDDSADLMLSVFTVVAVFDCGICLKQLGDAAQCVIKSLPFPPPQACPNTD